MKEFLKVTGLMTCLSAGFMGSLLAGSVASAADAPDLDLDHVQAYLEPVETPVELRMQAEALDLTDPATPPHSVASSATPAVPASPAKALPAGTIASTVSAISAVGSVLTDISTIINLGQTAWKVIQDNAPAATLSDNFANAIPKAATSVADLAGFSDLQYHSYRLYGVNGFGEKAYDITFTVVHQSGGSFNGQGKYLANVNIIPAKVDVAWGYKVNLSVIDAAATNVGTAQAPVAALAVQMNFQVQSWSKLENTSAVYEFRGDSADVIATPLL